MEQAPLILASASPRRRALLEQIGLSVEVRPAHIDETIGPEEGPEAYVERMAREKADAACGSDPRPLLAADTIVVLDDRVLGKPTDRADGVAMLLALSGREHRVMTAVHLRRGDHRLAALSISHVRMREIEPVEAERYWATGEPVDKAGGYAIQGAAAVFVSHLTGSHSGIVGLPLCETAELLARVGLVVPAPEPTR